MIEKTKFHSRRHFFKATGGLALASAGLAKGPLAGRIKIAVKYHMIQEPELSVVEKFLMLKRAGFDGVELKTTEKVDHDEVLAAISKTGLSVHGIVNASSPDVIAGVKVAKKLGADSVLILAAEDKNLSWDENFPVWQKRVSEAIPLAKESGVKLCIENVRATFLKTAEGMSKFIDSFESDVVKSYFDLGNTITWTEQSGEHWADVLAKRIYKLDIKDRGHAEFGDPKTKRAGITTGTNGGEVNWADVRKELAEVNFSGWATAEVAGGDEARLTRMAAWMRDVLDLEKSA
ncbi:sugar phosphate isomerase/epimerase [Verrucomicrobiales bacterium]|nr:sugar phosphate isomerase/epimerase [Verrucomicrobiales bacterium]MDC0258701.1 sugar phosphate isomerase/epimerase [Verrucomicrobiales bacterium]MDC0314263.1 sugar phosphate isomerase/epimerase [bacterium]